MHVLTRIDITLQPTTTGSVATVAYTKTALDDEGKRIVRRFAEHFASRGRHWESAINAVLTGGVPGVRGPKVRCPAPE